MGRKSILSTVLFFVFFVCSAQEIVPTGYFVADSMRIGEAFDFSLSIKYPLNSEVIFPDSSHNYSPFEFYSKKYFATRTDSIYAYDSVIYSLASFEIDKIQYLQLPIYMLDGKDSIQVLSEKDSIFLDELIPVVPDSLILKENVAFHKVPTAINYPYVGLGVAIFLVLLATVYFIFGKTIRKKIQLYRLRKEYEKFSLSFERGINKVRKDHNVSLIEEVLVVWKKYMEKLEDKPFTKYTTREILRSGYDQTLKDVLRNIDRSIYGQFDDEQIHKNFETLEDFTLDRYKLRLREVTNE
ncbi:MAG: hypothetical protein JXQ96_08650 [Cyclobacteriaceae bacterium]